MCSEVERRLRTGFAALLVAACCGLVPATAQASTGTIAYVHTDDYQVPFTVWRMEPSKLASAAQVRAIDASNGRSRRLVASRAWSPAWSPSGDRVAFVGTRSITVSDELFVSGADGSRPRLVRGAAGDSGVEHPSWSPDGTRLVFARLGREGIFSVRASGGPVQRLASDGHDPTWGSDGRIAFARDVAFRRSRILVMNGDGSGVRPLTDGSQLDSHPSWSPDGSRIAFARESVDRTDVYTIGADGTGLQQITSAGPDEANAAPAWSPDGTAIAYAGWGPYGNDHEIVIVDLATRTAQRITDNLTDDLAPAWRGQPAAPAAAVVRLSTRRPLSGRRRRFAGLRTWIRSPQEGNGSECMALVDAEPSTSRTPMLTFHTHQSVLEVLHGGRQEIGTRGFTCAYGFRAREPLRFALTHPDGKVEQLPPRDDAGGDIAYWVARRDDDEGTYTITATQGSRQASIAFRVVAPQSPHLIVLDPRERSEGLKRLGSSVPILITGVSPRSKPWIDLYRAARRRLPPSCRGCPSILDVGHRYFNSVRVRAGGDGTVLYQLPTSRSDPPGKYLISLRLGRRQYSGAEFRMRRR